LVFHVLNLAKVTDPDASSEEAQMANEYEKLSQMCLKQKKYAHDVGY
jgi:hypothetical protein